MPTTLLGTMFRDARTKKKKTLFDVAVEAEVSTQTVLNLEKKGSCALSKALRIASVLGIDNIPVR